MHKKLIELNLRLVYKKLVEMFKQAVKMGYKIRRSNERKFFDHGWLKTYHTFSFGSYFDPNFMGFRSLRVINEDRVEGGHGFPLHDHEDMEIVSLVLEGELAHKDSMGTESVIYPNQIQAMSAGTGITHAEFNPADHPVHFMQIWIIPDTAGIKPRYQQRELPKAHNEWVLMGSKSGKEDSIKIQQDVEIYALTLDKDKHVQKNIPQTRYGWLQVIEGKLALNDDMLSQGDGVAIEPNTQVKIKALSPSKILFFHLN